MKSIFLILFLIIINQQVYSKNLFDTLNYNIEFSSENIENDKINEINKIKTKSILYIFKNILSQNDFLEIKNYLTNDFINPFIKNIIISDEKIINNKYIAKIKVNYNKNKIIDFLRSIEKPYVEYQPDKFLLVIYEIDKINNNLLTRKNNFYEYFNTNLNNNGFFQIPNLDINDRYILKEEDIIKRDLNRINHFFKKYNSNENIIVEVKKNKNKINYNLILLSDGNVLEKKIILDNNEIDLFFKDLEKETIDLWKQMNQIQNKNLNFLRCKVDYFNMLELKEIRKKFKNVSVINSLNIKTISYKNIEYDIYYYGNLKILFNILKLNKLKINYNQNKCKIRLI